MDGVFGDSCSTLYLSSRPCHMLEDYFHQRFSGQRSFLVIRYFSECSAWYTGSKYAECFSKSSGICHPQ